MDEFKKYKYALSQYLEFYENYKLVLKIKPENVTYPRLRYAWRMHEILKCIKSDKNSGKPIGIEGVIEGGIIDGSGNIIEPDETKNNKPSSPSGLNVSYNKFLKECEKEEMKRLSLEEYLEKLHFVFDFIEKENYQKFVNLIKSDKRLDEYEKIVTNFEKSFNMCARKPINKKEVGHDFFRLLKPYLNVILHEFEEYIS